jgi:hypothetical protein
MKKGQGMGRKLAWDDDEADWFKASIYPKRYEGRAIRNLSPAAIERDDKINALLDQEFGLGSYIPSPKMFASK